MKSAAAAAAPPLMSPQPAVTASSLLRGSHPHGHQGSSRGLARVHAPQVSRRIAASATTAAPTTLTVETVAHVIPHPDKVAKGGEDAFMIQTIGSYSESEEAAAEGEEGEEEQDSRIENSATALAVFDGVGGWAEEGIDPALYSNQLCTGVQEAAEKGEKDPILLLSAGYTSALNNRVLGAATALVAVVSGENLEVANLGDSGLRVIRDGQVVFKSSILQHYFDCPRQLGHESDDRPIDSERIQFSLQKGDVIMLATDGLLDNIFDEDVAEEIGNTLQKRENNDVDFSIEELQECAQKVAQVASAVSLDETVLTPYSVMAEEEREYRWWEALMASMGLPPPPFTGGKVDDITIVLGLVKEVALPPPPPAAETQPEDVKADADKASNA